MLCLCCLVFLKKNRTKWFCCLHLVVIFPFCCFVLNFVYFLFFFIPLKKKTPQKPDTAKTQKSKNAEKTDKKRSVSAVVFTARVFFYFLGWALKIHFLAENTIVVSASFQTGKNTPKLAKRLSQNLVQVC